MKQQPFTLRLNACLAYLRDAMTYGESKPISDDAKIDEFSNCKVDLNHSSCTAMQLTFAIKVLPSHAGTQVDTFLEFY